jgi:hypothetical protein
MHAALITKLGSLPSDTVSNLPSREFLSVFRIRGIFIRFWILGSVSMDYVPVSIRILLFSSVAFKMPTKVKFFSKIFAFPRVSDPDPDTDPDPEFL